MTGLPLGLRIESPPPHLVPTQGVGTVVGRALSVLGGPPNGETQLNIIVNTNFAAASQPWNVGVAPPATPGIVAASTDTIVLYADEAVAPRPTLAWVAGRTTDTGAGLQIDLSPLPQGVSRTAARTGTHTGGRDGEDGVSHVIELFGTPARAVNTASYTLTVSDQAGNQATQSFALVVRGERPKVDTLTVTSVADDGEAYRAGERVTLALGFDRAVVVEDAGGAPRLTLDVGGDVRRAALVRARGRADADVLHFEYEVNALDSDADGLSVSALDLNGARISAVADGADARTALGALCAARARPAADRRLRSAGALAPGHPRRALPRGRSVLARAAGAGERQRAVCIPLRRRRDVCVRAGAGAAVRIALAASSGVGPARRGRRGRHDSRHPEREHPVHALSPERPPSATTATPVSSTCAWRRRRRRSATPRLRPRRWLSAVAPACR